MEHRRTGELKMAVGALSVEELGFPQGTEVKQYDPDFWSLHDFIRAWKEASIETDWFSFYAKMAYSCFEASESIVPPLKLEARLRTCERHLRTKGYGNLPPYPKRPVEKRVSLTDVMDDLGEELGFTFTPPSND